MRIVIISSWKVCKVVSHWASASSYATLKEKKWVCLQKHLHTSVHRSKFDFYPYSIYICFFCIRGHWEGNKPSWVKQITSGCRRQHKMRWIPTIFNHPEHPDWPFSKAEKIKQQIGDSDRGKAHEWWICQLNVFAPQVFQTALPTGPSVRTEARQNMTAGTFSFQSHALLLVKENSHEILNDHRQCLTTGGKR